ncbi:unnamed protein product [Sympodiomycopsis kandeliae]
MNNRHSFMNHGGVVSISNEQMTKSRKRRTTTSEQYQSTTGTTVFKISPLIKSARSRRWSFSGLPEAETPESFFPPLIGNSTEIPIDVVNSTEDGPIEDNSTEDGAVEDGLGVKLALLSVRTAGNRRVALTNFTRSDQGSD